MMTSSETYQFACSRTNMWMKASFDRANALSLGTLLEPLLERLKKLNLAIATLKERKSWLYITGKRCRPSAWRLAPPSYIYDLTIEV